MDGEFQREAKKAGLFSHPLSSCEAELQELMRQVDIMVHNRQLEWDHELERVRGQLRSRQQEVNSQQAVIETTHQEVGRLRHRLQSDEAGRILLAKQYEQKLALMRTQLNDLQKDYEKVLRRHDKLATGADRERDEAVGQLAETQSQLKKASETIKDYERKTAEWDIQRRAFRQQTESLETQRKTLADKCELIKQQSLGYQDQLSKRRHLLEQTEVTFRSRITHLEGALARSQDAVEEKSALVQRLEQRLGDAEDGRREDEGTRREADDRCQAAENRAKQLDDENHQLHSVLQSRDRLIGEAEQAMKQHRLSISRLEEKLLLEQDMVRSLKEDRGQEASVTIQRLESQVEQTERDNSRLKRAQLKLQENVEELQTKLDKSHLECASLNTELANKLDELRHLEGNDIKELHDQLAKTREICREQEQQFLAHLDGMRSEVDALTSELHLRDNTIALLSQKVASAERSEREEAQLMERHQHELQITNAQLDALRIENQSLRESSRNSSKQTAPAATPDISGAELKELKDMNRQHVNTSRLLEEEASMLKRKLASTALHLQESESASDARYQTVIRECNGRITRMKEEYQRHLKKLEEQQSRNVEILQARLNSTAHQNQAEISTLRDTCSTLKRQLKDKTHRLNLLEGENTALAGFVNNIETLATSPEGSSPPLAAVPHPSSPRSTSRVPATGSHHQPSSQVTSPPSPPRPSPKPSTTTSNKSSPFDSMDPSSPPTHRPERSSSLPSSQLPRRRSPAARKLFDDEDDFDEAESPVALHELLGFPELDAPSDGRESKLSDSRRSITASFVAEDIRRTRDFEQLFDDHIANLERQTEDVIRGRKSAVSDALENA